MRSVIFLVGVKALSLWAYSMGRELFISKGGLVSTIFLCLVFLTLDIVEIYKK